MTRTGSGPAGALLRSRAQHGVAIIGCGLIGARRAQVVAGHAQTRLTAVVDVNEALAAEVASGRCAALSDWRHAVLRDDTDIVVVATPNGLLAEVVTAALDAGKHVLMEKPMGRSLEEARRITEAAAKSGRILAVGFNHRQHPGVRRALELVRAGAIGRLITLRGRYGHGGRPGLEREWRSDPAQAGGGELLDQGIHMIDLFIELAGLPRDVFGIVQTAVWKIGPLEDNAYALLKFDGGVVGQLHASMTQWKNLFSLEVHGEAGAVLVEGLGGSYGAERLVHVERAFEGGAPQVHEQEFAAPDVSWSDEWDAFLGAVDGAERAGLRAGAVVARGCAGPAEALQAMRVVDAIYRSAATGVAVSP
jgi:predicted dehydrogenase